MGPTTATALTAADIDYVRTSYVTLADLGPEHATWIGVMLPLPTYRLADGTSYFPRDWARLAVDAGSAASTRGLFARRYHAAAAALGEPDQLAVAWQAYLAGLYGACLREVTPENIVAKARLVARLDRALACPAPDQLAWCATLRADVEALDGISRPFATCDRIRFGRPTSRERLITDVRERYPHAFLDHST
ncbi:MAG TPA: DUF6058 family natural product biosynthesis protein [Kofleriaceae bacterium]|nr:DUF6058 family natural product biosynthesis protein [Kofleriaceae bacterium]